MPELENVKEQKTAGYMSRTRMTNKERIKKAEEELKELVEQQGNAVEEKKEEAKTEVDIRDEDKYIKKR